MLSIERLSNHMLDELPSYVIHRKGFQTSCRSGSMLCYLYKRFQPFAVSDSIPCCYIKGFLPYGRSDSILCYIWEGYLIICRIRFQPILSIGKDSNHLPNHIPFYVIYMKGF